MDTYSSGDDLVIKTRKPYTITKQRERWTEEEHNRFLEALKLYGRAWQRIEEHIGTKTAVQIRSHAQKFFSKLEKEAVAKGIPVGQALDIDIPPPRPKRKPSNPYPRKTGLVPTVSQEGLKDAKVATSASFPDCNHVLDLEKEPLREKPSRHVKQTSAKENQGENCSEVFTVLPEGHCSSVSSVNKHSTPAVEALRHPCSFREFVPSLKKVANQDSTKISYETIQHKEGQNLGKLETENTIQVHGASNVSKSENSSPLQKKTVQSKRPDDFTDASETHDIQAMQNYPRHVPVHVLYGSLGTCMQAPSSDMTCPNSMFHPMGDTQGHPLMYAHPATSGTTDHPDNMPRSTQRLFPTFPSPFTPSQNSLDDYRSLLLMSSTFSSLIVSTLLQNPAAHAAASFAATFSPYTNVENSADSLACTQGGFQSRQMNSAPSMEAIATATVAAASAWWTAHGLLPLCAPLHASFSCPPPSTAAVPPTDSCLVPAMESKETILDNPIEDQQLGPKHTEALQAQNSASKYPAMSSSDSEESGDLTQKSSSKATDLKMNTTAPETHDSSKTEARKQVDRSSCGSNTPSSSDVETDALEKHEKGKEESNEVDVNHPVADSGSQRSRSSGNVSDSWKEVSEEGRLAFQALFTRGVLPQSFSPRHDLKATQNKDIGDVQQITEEKEEGTSELDLNSKTWASSSGQQATEGNIMPGTGSCAEEGLLKIGPGNGKIKARRTGFKPYKRCSVEAKESRAMSSICQGEERGPKKIRLDGGASI